MHTNIFNYIDKIVNIVRPQKILYLAIDGVAPRAKMNQQRSRRFRAAQESAKMMEKKRSLYEAFVKKGITSKNLEKFIKEKFDHTVITPGTEFMDRLSNILKVNLLLNYDYSIERTLLGKNL
jgi:5'-3' exoribonuclease 2